MSQNLMDLSTNNSLLYQFHGGFIIAGSIFVFIVGISVILLLCYCRLYHYYAAKKENKEVHQFDTTNAII